MTTTAMSGHCLCGAISWTAPGPVIWAGHCHCESCRRACSAPFTSFFGVARDSVRWRGEPSAYQSSPGITRGLCDRCGSPLYYKNDKLWPDEIHLFAATLDDPSSFVPEAHYHYAERVSWIEIDDDLPRFAGSDANGDPL